MTVERPPVYYFVTPYRPTMRHDVSVMPDGLQTAFVPLKYLYPECLVLINDEPQLYPLQCLRTNCHRNQNCMGTLARRVKYMFDNVVPEAGMIIAYYKWRNEPNTIKAGVFMSDFSEPRQIKCRTSAFRRYQREGDAYRWDPPAEYWLIGDGNPQIIPVEGLIKP